MPEQKPSHLPCSEFGALALDAHDVGSNIYQKLGLKEQHKKVHGTPRFLLLLSTLLENSVQENEMLLVTEEMENVPTIFNGLKAPPVSIQQYVDRIFKYAGCSRSCFIVAYIYLDRYLQRTEAYLTSLNVHRLLVTCVMVAAKFIDDGFYNNAYYAKVGGVSTSEMNRLEMKFLFGIDFRLQVSVETFRNYCLRLEKEAGGCQIERPVKACWIQESWSRKDDSQCGTPVAR